MSAPQYLWATAGTVDGMQVRKAGKRYRFENRAPDAKPICYATSEPAITATT